jgi:predicted RNA-binding protein YlxR (DUF448 family)
VACRTSGDKRGLLRVVRNPEGAAVFDPTGKASGRGAYVCASEVCIRQAHKQKKLDRSLKATVTEETIAELLARSQPGAAGDA